MSDNQSFSIQPIAHIRTDFPAKFGIPRQSMLIEALQGVIIFEPLYRNPDALRGIEDFSHLWLIWQFNEAVRSDWSPTVRPPRLGGNKRMGVFATRSPFRPNSLALSCVKIEKIELNTAQGPIITVSGIDMMDNTPIIDIKPYLPHIDCVPSASGGFALPVAANNLRVVFVNNADKGFSDPFIAALTAVLEQDPRPHYQQDENRIYGFTFRDHEVHFTVRQQEILVQSVEKI